MKAVRNRWTKGDNPKVTVWLNNPQGLKSWKIPEKGRITFIGVNIILIFYELHVLPTYDKYLARIWRITEKQIFLEIEIEIW